MIRGNLLKETISNLPVIIVEKTILEGIIDKDILENIDNIIEGKWLNENNYKNVKIRIIPFSSLGNENGILLGIKPDYIKLYINDDCEEKEAFIGIYQGNLCNGTNEYNAIVGL